mmetsp:Transcript_3402/g.6298  ORF Transcript_3402/g.6298 Transcript_3402/m.6298 type:complete len:280 (-) Transcript_3402:218-1057(-)
MEGPEALSLIPIAGLILYLGLISGYIPSPLYYRNEKWPKQYAILQLVVLIMTAARLTKYSNSPYPDNDDDNEENEEEDYEYKYDLEELSQFSNWLGTSLHKWFYKHFKEDALEVVMEIGSEFIFLGLSIILAMVVNRNDRLRKWDDTNLPMSKVFLRNFLIFISINVLFICETLLGPESSQGMYCEKTYNVTPGLIAPEYPISQLVTEFVDAWKVFHPSNLVLVRLSHSILYPSVLLLLTRRRLTTFIIWLLFTEIDFFSSSRGYVSLCFGAGTGREKA